MTGRARSFCIDASVGAKCFLQREDASGAALALLEGFVGGDFGIVVPELFYYELGDVLALAVRRHRVPEPSVLAALDELQRLGLGIVDLRDRLGSIFAFSRRFGVSFYDAAYLAAAEAGGSTLVTFDQRLLQAASPVLDWVRSIESVLA